MREHGVGVENDFELSETAAEDVDGVAVARIRGLDRHVAFTPSSRTGLYAVIRFAD